jgi:hypothetical protein
MVALARRTLLHEWRRFMPAAFAVGFACLLQLLQAAFVLGIFSSASVYVTGSTAALWIGYPGTQSVNIGRPIRADVEARLRMDPDIERVEPFLWLDADWQGPRGTASVFVSGINVRGDGMMFARSLPAATRALLSTRRRSQARGDGGRFGHDQWTPRTCGDRVARPARAGRRERACFPRDCAPSGPRWILCRSHLLGRVGAW